MLPPNNIPLSRLGKEEGILRATLAKWGLRRGRRASCCPEADTHVEGWTSRDKLAALNETELGDYRRRRGIFPKQISLLARSLRDDE
ncbi:hypothetical protein [Poseidonocella sp. HB161398]|uniref:hypothetical protein n=1 Tax=Poseidonocella sp. HB161398 TaxID=2320855 RepID=UPI001109DADF|nr:hypothetical protein [Poseidonocella sp. HB161398]